MTEYKCTWDTYIDEEYPLKDYGNAGKLLVREAANHKYPLLHFSVPGLNDSYVKNAELHIFLADNWEIGQTIYVDRLIAPFNENTNWRNYRLLLPTLPGVGQASHTLIHNHIGNEVHIDVTDLVSDAAAANAFYGLMISTGGSTPRWIFSSESNHPNWRPYLLTTFSQTPPAPTNLSPSEGASKPKPKFSWDAADQTAFQVQISTTQNGNSPDADSGWIFDGKSQLNTADTSLLTWTVGVPNDGDSTSWRVRVQNESGATSLYSAWVTYTRHVSTTVTITSPASDGDQVDATTPLIEWDIGTGDFADESAYEVLVQEVNFDSGRISGQDSAYEIPAGIIKKKNVLYTVEVRLWDKFVRDAASGGGYVSDDRTFYYDAGGATAPVTALTAVQDGPAMVLTFTRSSQPDKFVVLADDDVLIDNIDPGQVPHAAGVWEYRLLRTPSVDVPIVFEVRANDGASGDSSGNATATGTFAPIGIWIVDEDSQIEVQLLGQENIDTKITEDGATFVPLGAQAPVRIVDQIRGYEGTINGLIDGVTDRDNLLAIKALAPGGGTVRLIYGAFNYPIDLGEVTISELPVTGGGIVRGFNATVGFSQAGRPWPV